MAVRSNAASLEGPPTLEQLRSRRRNKRPDRPRSRTLEDHQLRAVHALEDIVEPLEERPRYRGECQQGPRPCPFVSCSHHLYLDVNESGSIKLNFPEVGPDELELLPDTCALDVAERGGVSMSRVGARMNLSREGARQFIKASVRKLRAAVIAREVVTVSLVPTPPRSGTRVRLPVVQDFDVEAFASDDLSDDGEP